MRIPQSLLLSIGLCLLFSCQPKQERPTLSDEQLAALMADFSLAEGATYGLAGIPKDSLRQVYNAQVFKMHGLTLADYERDIKIVCQDLTHIERVNNRVEEILKAKQTETSPSQAAPIE